MIKRALLAGIAIIAMGAYAQAATIQLGLTTSNPAATSGTWTLTATVLGGDSSGLASFSSAVNVTPNSGASGVAATTSTLAGSLRVANPDNSGGPTSVDNFPFIGFIDFRSNGSTSGTNRVGIAGSQHTVDDPNNLSDGLLMFNQGVGSPVTLATGAWTATTGQGVIQAALNVGSLFNVFPTGFHAGGATVAATQIVASAPITIGVPEPATIALMGFAGLGLIAFRRRK